MGRVALDELASPSPHQAGTKRTYLFLSDAFPVSLLTRPCPDGDAGVRRGAPLHQEWVHSH